jgi:hypothetical protein
VTLILLGLNVVIALALLVQLSFTLAHFILN